MMRLKNCLKGVCRNCERVCAASAIRLRLASLGRKEAAARIEKEVAKIREIVARFSRMNKRIYVYYFTKI